MGHAKGKAYNITLNDQQMERLSLAARRVGEAKAVLCRRAIAAYVAMVLDGRVSCADGSTCMMAARAAAGDQLVVPGTGGL